MTEEAYLRSIGRLSVTVKIHLARSDFCEGADLEAKTLMGTSG